ncbi:MAG: hypothetical protein R3E89_16120 [Thiolinea sp.]
MLFASLREQALDEQLEQPVDNLKDALQYALPSSTCNCGSRRWRNCAIVAYFVWIRRRTPCQSA